MQKDAEELASQHFSLAKLGPQTRATKSEYVWLLRLTYIQKLNEYRNFCKFEKVYIPVKGGWVGTWEEGDDVAWFTPEAEDGVGRSVADGKPKDKEYHTLRLWYQAQSSLSSSKINLQLAW